MRRIAGWAVVLFESGKALLDWLGRFDIVHKLYELAWVKPVIEFLSSVPSWTTIPIIVLGLALIFWDSRRTRSLISKLDPGPQVIPPTKGKKTDDGESESDLSRRKAANQKSKIPLDSHIEESRPVPLPKSLKDLFNEDFSNCLKFTNQCSISSADGKNKTDVPWHICNDSTAGTKFLSLYIPRSPDSYNVCAALSDFPHQAIEHERKSGVEIQSKSPGDSSHVDMKDLQFSGRVYLYDEALLSLTELGALEALYKSKNLFPQFRGSEYVTARWFQENVAAKQH
jgi:hypothetical protein